MLEVRALRAGYGPVEAVRGIDLVVRARAVTVLVGPNGAGKTTALRAIMGQHRQATGTITVSGERVPLGNPVRACRAGLAIVPQGRRVFATLTVDEHLDLASSRGRQGAMTVAELTTFFPGLDRRRRVRAQSLSGGEQQMLAIARALLLGPSVLLMDEPMEGLAPAIVNNVMELISYLPSRDIAVVVTDQQGGPLTEIADDVRVMDRGTLHGTREVSDAASC